MSEQKFVGGLLAIGVFLIIAFILTLPLMFAINYVFAPTFLSFVFGSPSIGWVKSFILLFVCVALFKSGGK